MGIERVVDVQLVGYRGYVLAVAQKMVAPQVQGEAYVYFQCDFFNNNNVSKMDYLNG